MKGDATAGSKRRCLRHRPVLEIRNIAPSPPRSVFGRRGSSRRHPPHPRAAIRGRTPSYLRAARRTTRAIRRRRRNSDRRERTRRRARSGGRSHPPRVARRPGAGDRPPTRGRGLRRDCGAGRGHQRHGSRNAGRDRGRAAGDGGAAPLGDARARHHDGRGQVGLRPDGGARDPGPADSRLARRGSRPAAPGADGPRRARDSPRVPGRPRRMGSDRGRGDRSARGAEAARGTATSSVRRASHGAGVAAIL